MTRAEREQLIERYLAGELTSIEENDFFLEVGIDPEFRHDLKAYRLVDRAMEKEGDAFDATYTTLRSHVQGMLASSPVGAAVNGIMHDESSRAPIAQAARGTRTIVGWIGGIALAAFLLTVLLVDPFGSTPRHEMAPARDDSRSVLLPEAKPLHDPVLTTHDSVQAHVFVADSAAAQSTAVRDAARNAGAPSSTAAGNRRAASRLWRGDDRADGESAAATRWIEEDNRGVSAAPQRADRPADTSSPSADSVMLRFRFNPPRKE